MLSVVRSVLDARADVSVEFEPELREELVQVAAVATAWLESLPPSDPKPDFHAHTSIADFDPQPIPADEIPLPPPDRPEGMLSAPQLRYWAYAPLREGRIFPRGLYEDPKTLERGVVLKNPEESGWKEVKELFVKMGDRVRHKETHQTGRVQSITWAASDIQASWSGEWRVHVVFDGPDGQGYACLPEDLIKITEAPQDSSWLRRKRMIEEGEKKFNEERGRKQGVFGRELTVEDLPDYGADSGYCACCGDNEVSEPSEPSDEEYE